MAEFCMEIAGQVGKVQPLFESTRVYFQKYLTDRSPDFLIPVTREALAFEQQELDREALQEGLRLRKFTEPFLERAAIARAFALWLLPRGAVLMHGSAVAVDGVGYLFAAKCGTGKSTHTRLWRQEFGQRAVMINDDKPYVLNKEGKLWLCGSPWSGKHGLDTNLSVPLRGICILERGEENTICPLKPEQAASMLLHHAQPPLELAECLDYPYAVEQMVGKVSVWRMACNREPEAAHMAWAAMSGSGNV